MSEYKPKVVCFSCKFGWGYLTDEGSIAAQTKNWIPIICSGKIDAAQMMNAFRAGADGVLILGCPEGNCHYQDGNFEARKKVRLLGRLLEAQGIEKERIRIELSTDPDGKTIPVLVEKMSKDLAKLGPLKTARPAGKAVEKPVEARRGK